MNTPLTCFEPSQSYEEALNRICSQYGIETEYWDIFGQKHETSAGVRRAIAESLGVSAASQDSLDHALEERLWQQWSSLLPKTLVLGENRKEIQISVPVAPGHEAVIYKLRHEDGLIQTHRIAIHDLRDAGGATLRGRQFAGKILPLPKDLGLGYHEIEIWLDVPANATRTTTRLIVCPSRTYLPAQFENGGRGAGIAVSLYGLRSDQGWGCGDFTDLRGVIDWVAEDVGASFVALNPLHALHNRAPYNTSPYLPLSIFYRNFIYLDIESIEDFQGNPCAQKLRASAGIERELADLRSAKFVEYERVHRLKLRFLKLLFRRFMNDYRRNTARAQSFREYAAREGALLDRFAVFCALDEILHRRSPNVWTWRDWPTAYQDAESEESSRFAKEHWRTVLFYKYMQWQLDLQAAEAQKYAVDKGLSIGLYHDLALATDRCGSDLWAHRPFYVTGCRVGAPPDNFSPKGQDWAFPPPSSAQHRSDGYRLFVESIRKSARHGGALRIDHVMRFFHLFWIPDGMEASEGTYVRDAHEDLLRLLALESVRQKLIVVGEDLGTVTDAVRSSLERFGILSYRLFYFEKDEGGGFKLPQHYQRQALVASTTHDLPTLAGFWRNRDIEARRGAGLLPDDETYQSLIEERKHEKQKMLDVLFRLGLLPDWFPHSAAQVPELTGELHNAVIGFLASTPAQLLAINQEDLTKETEQQNLPGSTAEYPNWRRKMRFRVEDLRASPEARDLTAMLRHWLARTGRTARSHKANPT